MSRDRTVGETFYIAFTTRAFATGVPTTLAGTPVVSAYEDASLTQITAGITLGVDHDSVTGLNMLTIVATGGNGYEAGKDYQLVITTGTVSSVSVVGEVIGQFSLGLSAAFTRLGAPAGASVSADIATVDGNVDSILVDTAEIGTAGAGLTDLGGMSTGMKAEVNTEVDGSMVTYGLDHLLSASVTGTDITDDSIIASLVSSSATADWDDFANTTDSLQAIRDRGDAAWTTGAGGSDRLLLVDTTIATLSTQTSFTLTAGSADNDAYNNCTIVIEDVSTSTQKSIGMVLDYVGSTKTVTLKEALAFTIATTDKVYILAENSLKSTVANRQLDVTATGGAGIDWANVESPTTSLDLSGTDIQLCDTVTTNTDTASTLGSPAGASVSADIAVIDTNVDQIETAVITNAAGTDVSADIAAVKVDTAATLVDTAEIGTAGAGLTDLGGMSTGMKAEVLVEALKVLTTQLTESYAANGVAPTLSESQFAIHQMLMEFAISGTTYTVKKLDSSTTAFLVTLDDATNPTSATR